MIQKPCWWLCSSSLELSYVQGLWGFWEVLCKYYCTMVKFGFQGGNQNLSESCSKIFNCCCSPCQHLNLFLWQPNHEVLSLWSNNILINDQIVTNEYHYHINVQHLLKVLSANVLFILMQLLYVVILDNMIINPVWFPISCHDFTWNWPEKAIWYYYQSKEKSWCSHISLSCIKPNPQESVAVIAFLESHYSHDVKTFLLFADTFYIEFWI